MGTKKYRVTPEATVSDIDLDAEEFTLRDGSRLTEERAQSLADAAARRLANLQPGRTSLSGGSTHSPVIQIRVPVVTRERLTALAAERGVSVSKLTRTLIEESLDHLAS